MILTLGCISDGKTPFTLKIYIKFPTSMGGSLMGGCRSHGGGVVSRVKN